MFKACRLKHDLSVRCHYHLTAQHRSPYARAFPHPNPKTFRQWMRNEFGERLYSIFFKTYTEKVWGMDCDEISADWAAQQIKGLNLGKALLDGVRRSLGIKPRGEKTAKTLIESFRHPRRGPGMM